MEKTFEIWKNKLAAARALYEGRVQIPLDPVDMKAVLDQHCPESFGEIHDDLRKRTPTHVLVTPDQLAELLTYVEAAE